MLDDQIRGRIASAASKRRASFEYAKQVLPHVQEAVRYVRQNNVRGESLRAIAAYLNEKGIKSQGGKKFGAETVSRLLYKTEGYNTAAAQFEFDRAVEVLKAKGEADKAEIERLRAERDRIIAEGVELARALRVGGDDVPPPPSLEENAKLIVHQHDHRKRTGKWDEEPDNFPHAQQSFTAWSVDLLRRSLEG